MDTKIERKLVEFVKELNNEEGKTYCSIFSTTGEEGNFAKKIDVHMPDKNDSTCSNVVATVEYCNYAWIDDSDIIKKKEYFVVSSRKIDMTVYEETSQKLWNVLMKFMKHWNVDNVIAIE